MIFSILALFYVTEQATTVRILCCRIWIMILGIAFSCTYHAWAQSLLPNAQQCRLASLGYTLGSRIIGTPSLVVGLWLFQKTSLVGAPLLYLAMTAIIAAIVIYYSDVPERKMLD